MDLSQYNAASSSYGSQEPLLFPSHPLPQTGPANHESGHSAEINGPGATSQEAPDTEWWCLPLDEWWSFS